jgi:hypothetical protein
MRTTATLTLALVAASLQAGELNPKVLTLIGENARTVYGGNLARYRQTVWNNIAPWRLDQAVSGSVQQLVVIANDDGGPPPLTIMIGSAAASEQADGLQFASLDSATSVFGDEAGTQEAVRRWRENSDMGELARKAQRLSESHDNWFLIVRPLELLGRSSIAPPSHFAAELMQMLEEASGGIRVGAFSEVHAEVLMKTADDAATLAGLGRWLPGLIQLKEPHGLQSRMIDLAENVSIRAEGRLATISLVISERKLEDMLKVLTEEANRLNALEGR